MKLKCLMAGAAPVAMLLLGGCLGGTRSTVTEYRTDGSIERCTVSEQSVVDSLTRSTGNKTVIVWESGWAAYVAGSTATTEDPTPHIKLFAGKADRGWVSALPGQQNWDGIARAIKATRMGLEVGATGVAETHSGMESVSAADGQ